MFDDLVRKVPTISPEAKYWFVRTNGGDLYDPFIATGSIAIGYGKISLATIQAVDTAKEESRENLKRQIKEFYPPKETEEGRTQDLSGLAASQLLRFCNEMKRGDIVVVPTEKTERLAVGTITGDPFEKVLIHGGLQYDDFVKRRPVRWIRGVDRVNLNPNLFKLFLNQQTIIDASPYAKWIDSLLYQFFRKGDAFHCVLSVDSKDHIRAQSLFRACLSVFDLAEEFAQSEGFHVDTSNVDTRINLNSPGDIEFWKMGVETIATIALLVVFINGGGVDIKLGDKGSLSLKTQGLIDKIIAFLNSIEHRKTVHEVREKLKQLEVRTPNQVIELLKSTKDETPENH